MFGAIRQVCPAPFLQLFQLTMYRDNGYLLPDKTQPCVAAASSPATSESEADTRCVVKLGWLWIDSASFRYVLDLVHGSYTIKPL